MKFLFWFLSFLLLLMRCSTDSIENVQLFNDFIRIILNGNDATKTINLLLLNAVKILEIMEKCAQEKFHDSNFGLKVLMVEHHLKNCLNEFKTLSPNNKIEQEIEAKLKIKAMSDKVQFFMLLFSFATRLAFTIGSNALEKRRNIFGFGQQIATDSFPLAYNQLNTAFPMNYQSTYKFRYFQAAIMQLNADDSIITFDFAKMESYSFEKQEWHQKYCFNNFKTLLHYLGGKKQRVGNIINECFNIATLSLSNQNVNSNSLFKLMNNWTGQNDFQNYSLKYLYALKNFAANLLKRIMRAQRKQQEAWRYFMDMERVMGSGLNQKLKIALFELNDKMRKYMKMLKFYAVNGQMFMDDDELLLHYEDAIQIDWRTREDFKIDKLYLHVAEWQFQIENCKFEDEQLIDCEIDFYKFYREIDENKILFENLDIKANTQLENLRNYLMELKKLKEEMEALERQNMHSNVLTALINNNKTKIEENKVKICKLLENKKNLMKINIIALRKKIEKVAEEFNF